MLDLYERLAQIMEKEAAIFKEFGDLSREKTDVILSGDIAALENIICAEKVLIKKVGNIEREREQCSAQLRELSPDGMPVVMSNLIASAPEEMGKRLEELSNRIKALIDEQQRLNSLNSRLLNNNLEYIKAIRVRLQGGRESNLLDKRV